MLRIEASDHEPDETVLFVDPAARRQLATVLSDWLAIYAGVKPAGLTPEAFDLVVELRRVLLSPDEPAVRTSLSARGAFGEGGWGMRDGGWGSRGSGMRDGGIGNRGSGMRDEGNGGAG